jgi:putative glycosyltransferase
MLDFSIVTTLYRSEAFLQEFYIRATAAATTLGRSYEIIFVNDGSPDGSLAAALEIAEKDKRVRVIDLSRNFGHHVAAFAAIEASEGDYVFLIDSDLEEKPEWLRHFAEVMEEQNADVVYGVQSEINSQLSGLFYKLFNAISDTPIPANACTVRLMRRSYVDALMQMRDRKLFMAGMFMWTGFRQVGVPVAKGRRSAGKSSYTLVRQMSLFADAVTSFSSKPLYAAFFAGTVFAGGSVLVGLYLILRKLLYPEAIIAGYTTLIVSITFMGGLTILFLGVIGLYVAKIFAEVKDRPLYLARPTSSQLSQPKKAADEQSQPARLLLRGLLS